MTAQAVLSCVDGRRVGQHVRELVVVDGDGRADVVGLGGSATSVGLS
ncbi:hypothetical protein [Kocuria nitroreducens]